MHDDNKSNNRQIGQIVPMGGSGKTKYFFLCTYLLPTYLSTYYLSTY